MKRREMLLTTGATFGLASFPLRIAPAAEPARKKVLMFTRSAGFQHSVITRKKDKGQDEGLGHAERILIDLGRAHNIEIIATKDGAIFDGDLDQFDGFFFYTTGDLTKPSGDKNPPMSAAGKKRFLDAVAAGKGFVGSHCASDTFHSEGSARENQKHPDPYIAMLGGEFISHGRQQSALQKVVDPKFPGADKLGSEFKLEEEWYSLKNFAPDLHVVLLMETTGMDGKDYSRPPFPSTWARLHEKGRVFYTSMGHREDVWTNPKFQDVVLGGLFWSLGLADAAVKPNLAEVAPSASQLS